jgi:hypothetical protein
MFQPGLTALRGLDEPMVVLGQVEAAGSTGQAAALTHCLEELILSRGLADRPLDILDLRGGVVELGQDPLQSAGVDTRLTRQTFQSADIAVQLLCDLALYICPGGDGGQVKQGFHRDPSGPGVVLRGEELDLFEEMLKAQEGPYTLVEWVLEDNLCGHGCIGAWARWSRLIRRDGMAPK